ncbi:MAG: hypothetical protein Q7S65_03945 [Nanoarchaeota archaeon]|nr:hypothetical protein [Nanoarchaeota archaeon]
MLNQTIHNGIIARVVRLCYRQPTQVKGSVEVSVRAKTTRANEAITMPRTDFSTIGARLGSQVWTNKLNSLPENPGFIGDEPLQLTEGPTIEPTVQPLTHKSVPALPNTLQVFQNDGVCVCYNLFAHVVVYPSHKPSLPAAQLPEKSFGGLCAFGLKFTAHITELDEFSLWRFEDCAITAGRQIVYAEVDAENPLLQRTFSINLFREDKQEEAFAFPIQMQETLCSFPREILSVAIRNAKTNFDSSLDSQNAQDIIFERCRAWKVIANRNMPDSWLALSLLDHSTGLFDASYGQLSRQSFPQLGIDEGVKFDIVPDFLFPRSIDAELESFLVNLQCSQNLFCGRNLDFRSDTTFHIIDDAERIYIACAHTRMSSGQESIEGDITTGVSADILPVKL